MVLSAYQPNDQMVMSFWEQQHYPSLHPPKTIGCLLVSWLFRLSKRPTMTDYDSRLARREIRRLFFLWLGGWCTLRWHGAIEQLVIRTRRWSNERFQVWFSPSSFLTNRWTNGNKLRQVVTKKWLIQNLEWLYPYQASGKARHGCWNCFMPIEQEYTFAEYIVVVTRMCLWDSSKYSKGQTLDRNTARMKLQVDHILAPGDV